jgi:hypothetical protein
MDNGGYYFICIFLLNFALLDGHAGTLDNISNTHHHNYELEINNGGFLCFIIWLYYCVF